jgi:NDP-sugar pyrophosphorylase family protein
MPDPLAQIPVLILAGGRGSRLAGVIGDVPKILAPVRGRPFAEILMARLKEAGFRNFILAIGHGAEQVKKYFRTSFSSDAISFSEEACPLGTGGAIWHARPRLDSGRFLVLNGDSLCDVEFPALLAFHDTRKALCSIVLSRLDNCADYGHVSIDQGHRILSFEEKGFPGSGLVNAGIYLIESRLFEFWNRGLSFSIESDLLPAMVPTRQLFGFVSAQGFQDIGTPERYARMQSLEQEG